jgi:hypothetical protein
MSKGYHGAQGGFFVNTGRVKIIAQLDVKNAKPKATENLPAVMDAGVDLPRPLEDGQLQLVLREENPGMVAFPVQAQLHSFSHPASGDRVFHALQDIQPCHEDASPRLGDAIEDQKTPSRSSQDMRSSRARPSNTPALPTPEYPSASRFGSRCRSEVFNSVSIPGERAAKPQRGAQKRGAHNAGLRAAKPRKRKADSGGN